jgi:hypothetical protein
MYRNWGGWCIDHGWIFEYSADSKQLVRLFICAFLVWRTALFNHRQFISTCLFSLFLRGELKKNGFPPEFPADDEKDTRGGTFLRIGSIDLSGDIRAYLKSRPLKKDIDVICWDLDALDELDGDIRRRSDENLVKFGKRGCTTDELYVLLQSFFGKKTRQFLADRLEDLSEGGNEAVDRVISATRKTASQYADDASDWAGEKIHDALADRLQLWGKSTRERGWTRSKQLSSMVRVMSMERAEVQ